MSELANQRSWAYTDTMLVNLIGHRQKSVHIKIVVWRCWYRTFPRGQPEKGCVELVRGYTGNVYINGKKHEPLSEHRTEYSLQEEAGKILNGYRDALYREDCVEYELARQKKR